MSAVFTLPQQIDISTYCVLRGGARGVRRYVAAWVLRVCVDCDHVLRVLFVVVV